MTRREPVVEDDSVRSGADLRDLVAVQAQMIEELRGRLEAIEAGGARPSEAAAAAPSPMAVAQESGDGRTGRRQLLSMAGVAAAGAVAGTAALASQATPAAAASGTFDGNPAVTGTTAVDGGVGVLGNSLATTGSAIGVRGQIAAPQGNGTQGNATATTGAARGVFGLAAGDGAVGVEGIASHTTGANTGVAAASLSSSGSGLVAAAVTGVRSLASRTHLRMEELNSQWPAPPLTTGFARAAGELTFDGSRWWVCVASGTPGQWREVAGPSTAGSLYVLDAAVRAYDSRAGSAPLTVVKGQLAAGQERTIDLKVGGGLPAGASAALINLTVTGTSAGGGFLKTFKPGAAVPAASAINWTSGGQNIANGATVAVSPTGTLTVRCGGSGASTDFIVDVAGYYL